MSVILIFILFVCFFVHIPSPMSNTRGLQDAEDCCHCTGDKYNMDKSVHYMPYKIESTLTSKIKFKSELLQIHLEKIKFELFSTKIIMFDL